MDRFFGSCRKDLVVVPSEDVSIGLVFYLLWNSDGMTFKKIVVHAIVVTLPNKRAHAYTQVVGIDGHKSTIEKR